MVIPFDFPLSFFSFVLPFRPLGLSLPSTFSFALFVWSFWLPGFSQFATYYWHRLCEALASGFQLFVDVGFRGGSDSFLLFFGGVVLPLSLPSVFIFFLLGGLVVGLAVCSRPQPLLSAYVSSGGFLVLFAVYMRADLGFRPCFSYAFVRVFCSGLIVFALRCRFFRRMFQAASIPGFCDFGRVGWPPGPPSVVE